MASLFTNLVQKVVISRKWTENGPMLDREWTDEVAEKSAQMSTVWAMMRVKLVNFAKLVMQIFKWTKWTKWTEQIFVESAKSAKSAKSIFATFATFASANFVGKASCESTVRYREWSRITLIKPLLNPYLTLTRFRLSLDSNLSRFSLASLICLCMLTVGVGNVWGTTLGTKTVSTTAATTLEDGDIVIMSDGTNYFSGTMTAVSKSKNWVQTTTTKADAFLLKVVGEYNNTTQSYKLQDYDVTKGYFKSTATGQTVWDTQSNNATSFTSLVGVGDYIYRYNGSGYRRYDSNTGNIVYLYKVSIATGPSITTSVSSLSDVGYNTTNFGQQVKSFTVSGSNLTANVTVTAPTNYEVCTTSGGPYTSSVSFDKGSGTLAASTVYVRLQSGKTAGNYSGNVAFSSSGATTKNVAVSGSVPFTVTWKANGTTYATTYVAYATSPGTALGSLPDDPDPSDYTCSPKAFYGWYDGVSYSNASVAPSVISTSTKITSDKTYNAVFANRAGSSKTYQFDITPSDFNSDGYDYNTGGTSTATATDASGATIDVTWVSNKIYKNGTDMQWKTNQGYIYNSTDLGTVNSVAVTSSAGGYNIWYGTTSHPTSGTSTGSGKGYFTVKENNTTTGKTTQVRVNFTKSNYTYSNYATTCCTPLGTINGSVSWTHPNEAEVSWDNLANVSSWTLKYKVHGAGAWTTAFTEKTGSDSEITVYSDGGTDNKMKSTIATTCNTAYDFLIIANPAIGYCEKEEELNNSGSGYNSGKWSVTYSLTGVTKSSGPATGANVCGDYTAVFAPSNAAYALPSDVTVQISGVTKTKDTDYTWDSSTGTLSIASVKITGDLSITVTGILVGCSADPSIGAASLSGAFGLSSVGVTVGTSSTGSAYCAWTDYGFVWGTSADPTVSDNKVQIGNSDAATTWSGSLTGSFSTGTTYYFRAYGTNSKTGAVPVYGTGNSFTPRSVTFDSNGGSAVATVYVNSGSTVSQPSAPTRTGYDFVKWQLNGADYIFSSAVNANLTLDAVWGAKSYTVTLDKQSGSGGTGSVSATYDADMPSATMPTRSGYDFGGYYGSEGGSGTQYYAADGSSAHTWDVADAKTLYAKWTAKNYTITLNNEGADSGKEGTESISVTFDANTNLTSAITKPVRDGYKFGGYFTSTDGSGTQIIDENGNVIASVASYTGSTKQWIYANDIELHAYWKPSYTVTWSVNGETTTEQVVSGEQVAALPTAPTSSDCDDAKVFVGWRSTAIDGVSAANPGSIFTTQAASPAITGDVTFYAVFADENVFSEELTNSEMHTQVCDVQRVYATSKSYTDGDIKYTFNVYNNAADYYWVQMKADDPSAIKIEATKAITQVILIVTAASNSSGGVHDISMHTALAGSTTLSLRTTSRTGTVVASGNGNNVSDNKLTLTISEPSASTLYLTTSAGCRIWGIKVYYTDAPYINYVTSCSSCDADATFTNTTPAVSAIDCDAATLTMTGGLATLGADGCNVSDYGFVIGTADNPAIGGVGVTKYQVGTTNPTTGEDFSYDATELTKGTHYYIRAYAKNGHGTAYSTSENFWTKDVSSIAITTAPTKTNYIVGETFDATGMVVTATMASGATEDVTSDVTYSTDALTAGINKDFAINYTLCETDKSVNQKINVYTLAVSEGTNPSYGSYTVDGAVITVSLEAQKTFSFATTNCSTRDNGNGTYTVINVTGNATVVINYRNAVQVKVYYKVDGTTITSLTQDVYESSQTTLPTASALSSAMTAQGMALPDELYPNFIGWSETEFGAQTSDPTLVTGTPIINAEKNYYAVYSNVNTIRIDESDITSTTYPGSEQTLTKSSKDFKYYDICKNNTYYLQFKKTNNSYIYNNTAISNIAKIEVGASDTYDAVAVYAGSAANTISGSALEDENTSTSKYIYLFPSNTQYFIIKGNSSYTYRVNYIDIYYASSTVYYMTQFCTRYDITGATTSGTAVIVNGKTGGTLTSSHNALCEGKSLTLSATVNTQYSFGEWKIVKTGSDPEVDLTADLLGANKTSLTPPAFAMPGYGITVSATISEKTATAWSWTYNSAAIPDPMILYVGEVKQLDVTYTPDAAQLVADQKNYSVEKESSVAHVSKTANYYRMRGAAGVTEVTNTTVTFSLNSLSQVVNVTVRPLPSATFEDNVHNAISTTVTATVTDGVVSLTKKTPTHADVAAPVGGNDCETTHLHLVGWIDGEWEPFINYMNGGSRPSDSDITSATGYFYLPNADIDLSVKGGKTYYAVWGKVDE